MRCLEMLNQRLFKYFIEYFYFLCSTAHKLNIIENVLCVHKHTQSVCDIFIASNARQKLTKYTSFESRTLKPHDNFLYEEIDIWLVPCSLEIPRFGLIMLDWNRFVRGITNYSSFWKRELHIVRFLYLDYQS